MCHGVTFQVTIRPTARPKILRQSGMFILDVLSTTGKRYRYQQLSTIIIATTVALFRVHLYQQQRRPVQRTTLVAIRKAP